jgi:hypothetical protein
VSDQSIKSLIPTSLLFSLGMVFYNYALLYTSISFLQMTQTGIPLMMLMIELFSNQKVKSKGLQWGLWMFVGLISIYVGELEFVWIGFCFQILGLIAETVCQKISTKNTKVDAMSMMYSMIPLSALMNGFAFFLVEGGHFEMELIYRVGMGHFFMNALIAFGYNMTVCMMVNFFDNRWETGGMVTFLGYLKMLLW